MRIKRGVTKHARHRKIINAAKGYYGRRKNMAVPRNVFGSPPVARSGPSRPASATA